ncbi:isoleucine--tRNA ligase [Desulfurivibrio alkaliphilus]|uniref:Isoleucine--tRNA ligase n=1 Tax=Desulfurivibrio alkaliphilus (strain DSM 19089 / UNIQEM U267 / AHT2) TaxID=589865 RepID=D6Z2V1_DESAT|nr:isoleucine--tRNA ligase [Desulfurivibrio alkaliphilus]ADH85876.1 isoleucyl-tRNA synthetase [Desulfurivibrio alkaliphilus AHT 2]
MDYRSTLNLPQTDFPMKANLARREPEMLKKWAEEGLYENLCRATAHRPLYVLHDGPPYANGHLHMGHALNKILKDIILKSKRMSGYHCPYVPGWDCHGLPIELNVDKELGEQKAAIGKLEFREKCRRYADQWIAVQSEEFQRLGVLGHWQQPYLTIDYRYEAAIAREFNNFLLNGLVSRSRKPVHWCASCRTALAEAEVEYADQTSPSIYVKFPLQPAAAKALAEKHPNLSPDLFPNLFLVIWTTTPWTLPANVAVALHPDFTYAAVEVNGETLIMAEELVEQVAAACGLGEYRVVTTLAAADLLGHSCLHPFMGRDSRIIAADYVTLEAGTGCVHTAPGHGREDYLSGLKHDLPVLSPVDDRGHFTAEGGPYAGMFILKGNKQIIADLQQSGALLGEQKISHSYPHCWRCKKPVIFRATEQWFIGMDIPAGIAGEQTTLREKALKAINNADWIPRWGRERIHGMVAGRPDWCLSRQRAWGVPITAVWCQDCGRVLNDEKIAARITDFFTQEGADAWFARPLTDFIGPEARCTCGSTNLTKEEDILDVWFDSGVSYAAVLEQRRELQSPADLYLEGSDQHRGWFQSALLAAVGTRGTAPYKAVLTHGFVVDGKGKKMSKSIGNVIAPGQIIEKHGAEILRLWAASEDYRDDIRISDNILKQLADAYRKIRNTVRFLLGNLHDFDPTAPGAPPEAEMDELDRWILARFEQLKEKTRTGYDSFEFHQVYHGLYNFCTVSLSALYLDIVKDRLYTMPADHPQRRAAQAVMYEICDGLLRLLAPILSFLAAEAWEYLPVDQEREASVFLASFPEARPQRLADQELLAKWDKILALRSEFTRALEIARRDKVIGHSLDAEVVVAAQGQWAEFIAANWDTLQLVTIVSAMRREEALPAGAENIYHGEEIADLQVLVRPAPGEKCERCWMRAESVGDNTNHPGICYRCSEAIG